MNTEYDPFLPDVQDNPFPYYDRLRRERPVAFIESRDFWVLSRYADIVRVSGDHQTFSSAKGVGPDTIEGIPMMLLRDPPAHGRLRCLVNKAFTPAMVGQRESWIRRLVTNLVTAVCDRGSFDFMNEIATPLPLFVIADILGISPERHADYKRWSDVTFRMLAGCQEPSDLELYARSWREFKLFIAPLLEERRGSPRDDLISVLVHVADGRDALTISEILNFVLLVMAAGTETTTNLLGNIALALIEHPDQANKIRRDPRLIPGLIEETLRYDSPVQGLFRTTTRDVQVGGVTIPKNKKVMLLYGSANRDPDYFQDPDRFDVGRSFNRHLSFGSGIHFCLGAQLAKLEARIVVEILMRKMGDLCIDSGMPPIRQRSPIVRGMSVLPVRFEPADASKASPINSLSADAT